MGMRSRRKGKTGELELAGYLTKQGFKSRRGRQYSGDPTTPDVISTLPFHIECKRTEALSIYKALEQAQSDAGDQPVVVFHRRNHKTWVVILSAEEFLTLIPKNSKGDVP